MPWITWTITVNACVIEISAHCLVPTILTCSMLPRHIYIKLFFSFHLCLPLCFDCFTLQSWLHYQMAMAIIACCPLLHKLKHINTSSRVQNSNWPSLIAHLVNKTKSNFPWPITCPHTPNKHQLIHTLSCTLAFTRTHTHLFLGENIILELLSISSLHFMSSW